MLIYYNKSLYSRVKYLNFVENEYQELGRFCLLSVTIQVTDYRLQTEYIISIRRRISRNADRDYLTFQERRKRKQRVRFSNEPLDTGRPKLAHPVEASATRVHLQRGSFGTSGIGFAENTQETIFQLPRAASVRPRFRFAEELVERGNLEHAEEVERQTGRRNSVTTAVYLPLFRRIVQETTSATIQRDRDRFQRYHEANLGEESGGCVSR